VHVCGAAETQSQEKSAKRSVARERHGVGNGGKGGYEAGDSQDSVKVNGDIVISDNNRSEKEESSVSALGRRCLRLVTLMAVQRPVKSQDRMGDEEGGKGERKEDTRFAKE